MTQSALPDQHRLRAYVASRKTMPAPNTGEHFRPFKSVRTGPRRTSRQDASVEHISFSRESKCHISMLRHSHSARQRTLVGRIPCCPESLAKARASRDSCRDGSALLAKRGLIRQVSLLCAAVPFIGPDLRRWIKPSELQLILIPLEACTA